MCYEQIVEHLKGLLTPIIAIITLYIAWQQWKINKQKYNLDLYERRLRIYQEIIKILSIIQRDANVSLDDLMKYKTLVSEADFLFGNDITSMINDVYKHGLELWKWKQEYRDSTQDKPDGYDHQKVVDSSHRELLWLTNQFDIAKKIFSKYLVLSR